MKSASVKKAEEIQSMSGSRKFSIMRQNLMLIYIASYDLGVSNDSRFVLAIKDAIHEIDGYLGILT